MNKMVSSCIRQALQYNRKAMKIHFQDWIKYIKTKYQKEKKTTKRENNHRKNHPHLGKKLNLQNLTQM